MSTSHENCLWPIGGRRLETPADNAIRPTSDKVRGAIFNALLSRVALNDAHVVDAFCGSGALGLEAISRGAVHCIFLDRSRKSLALAQGNAKTLGVSADEATFLSADSTKLPAATHKAQLVFLDPPYNKDLIIPTLQSLHNQGWLEHGAWCVIESEASFDVHSQLAALSDYLTIDDERTYGTTKIIYARYN